MSKENLRNKKIIEKRLLEVGYILNKYDLGIERLSKSQLSRVIKRVIDIHYGHTIVSLDGIRHVIEVYTEDWGGTGKELDMFTIEEYNDMYYNDIPLK